MMSTDQVPPSLSGVPSDDGWPAPAVASLHHHVDHALLVSEITMR